MMNLRNNHEQIMYTRPKFSRVRIGRFWCGPGHGALFYFQRGVVPLDYWTNSSHIQRPLVLEVDGQNDGGFSFLGTYYEWDVIIRLMRYTRL